MSAISKLVFIVLVLGISGCKRIDNGMEKHLVEAIDLYTDRMVSYSQVTEGQSDTLFSRLLFLEKMSLGMARIFDIRAYPYNERGIPIVTADFVPMEDNHGFGVLLSPAFPMGDMHLAMLREKISGFSASHCDFAQVAKHSADFLHWIAAFESTHVVYTPMLKHIVESIGFAALHAIRYAEQSSGETRNLSCDLVKLQIGVMKSPHMLFLEIEANKIHQMGVGVLVNDLPHIPFLSEYAASGLADSIP